MKKTLALLLSALAVAATITAATADTLPAAPLWEENVDYLVHGEMNHPNYPGSLATGLPEVTTGQLLRGTVVSGITTLEDLKDPPMSICDGNAATSFGANATGRWVGIILDQAYQLTEVRAVPDSTLTSEEMGGFHMQGSNDGITWVTIIKMGQIAHGNDYHIFTPQTVTDQRYIDAGYRKMTDESIHWVDNGGSYQYYRMTDNYIADVELYGNPAPATELNRDILSIREIATYNYFDNNFNIRVTDEVLNSVDGSLVGTIIGGGGVWNKALYGNAFDGNARSHYDSVGEGPKCWVGMMFDEPHALTEVRILPKRGGYVNIQYGRFQGSLDGHNWVDLVVFDIEDVPSKQEWVIKSITDPKGYTHFRYVATEQVQSSLAELLLFGAPAEAAEPITVEPLIATRYTYSGEILYSENKNTVTDTELSGTPIVGKYFEGWNGIESAFDGNIDTHYQTINGYHGSQFWIGLKLDEATAIQTVRFYNPSCNPHKVLYFQGSLDGVTWVDLATLNPNADSKDADGWFTKAITDTNAYSYYRIMNDMYDFPYSSFGVGEMKLYAEAIAVAPETAAPETAAPETDAPETDAPETTAPETAAPETAAPETAAPETAAPETAAPETAAPETAAPETDAPATDPVATDAPDGTEEPKSMNIGVIIASAAVVVVAIVAVIAIAKKKK